MTMRLSSSGRGADGRLRCLVVLAAALIAWPAYATADADVAAAEQALAVQPTSLPARLTLARAYFEDGRYADAKIEFDTVLRFANLPTDLTSEARIYARAAEEYLEQNGERAKLVGFEYAETGIGRYRVSSSSDTGAPAPRETFYLVNLGAALNYLFDNGYALDGSLAYDARLYDGASRNDSDLSWRAGVSRVLGDANIGFGLRGEWSAVGNGDHRTDYGAFVDWRRQLGQRNEIALATHLRRRHYPRGPLRDRSRTIAEARAEWIRSFREGDASFALLVRGGYHYATRRPDGDSGFVAVAAELDYPLGDNLGAVVSAEWERNRYNADQLHFHPDSLDEAAILRRRDVLYEIGAGLTWTFAESWALQPAILYVDDESNRDDFRYRSTELWVSVRKSF